MRDVRRTVWGIGTTRTIRAHWMLLELGLDYDTQPVQPRSGETQTAEYLAMDPRGKVPVYVEDELVIAESAAIITYLADRYAPGRFLPEPGTPERARHDQWCSFTLMELDATSLYVVRRHRDLAELYGEAPAAVASSLAYFERQVSVLETELSDGRPHVMGETFRIADILLVTTLDMARHFGCTLAPALAAYRNHVRKRPAYAAASEVNYPPEVRAAWAAARNRT